MRRTNTSTLSDVIQEFINKNKLEDGIDSARINKVWENVTGKIISNSTKDLKVEHNVLFVKIKSSLIRNEVQIIKSELVKRINNEIGRKFIKDIILR